MNLMPGRFADGIVSLPSNNKYPVPDKWHATLASLPNGEVIVGFRPEAARVGGTGPLTAQVYADDMHGSFTILHVALEEGESILHARASREVNYPIGTPIRFDLDPAMVRFFDPRTEAALTVGH